jgi:hypothetical protein
MFGAESLPYMRTTTIDSEGRFTFDRVHSDSFRVQLVDRAQRQWLPILRMSTDVEADVDLREFGCLTLSFRLDAPAGAAVSNALHCTLIRRGTGARIDFAVHKSPWRTEQIPLGEYTVIARGRPSWLGVAQVEVRAGDNPYPVPLEPSSLVTGNLQETAGNPVAGFIVRAAPDSVAPWSWDVTDDGGNFELIVPANVDALQVSVLGPHEPVENATVHTVSARRHNRLVR